MYIPRRGRKSGILLLVVVVAAIILLRLEEESHRESLYIKIES